MHQLFVGTKRKPVLGSYELGYQFVPPRKLGHVKIEVPMCGRDAGFVSGVPSGLKPITDVAFTNGLAHRNLPFARSSANTYPLRSACNKALVVAPLYAMSASTITLVAS